MYQLAFHDGVTNHVVYANSTSPLCVLASKLTKTGSPWVIVNKYGETLAQWDRPQLSIVTSDSKELYATA